MIEKLCFICYGMRLCAKSFECLDVLDEKKPNHFIIRFSVVVDDDGGKFEAFR